MQPHDRKHRIICALLAAALAACLLLSVGCSAEPELPAGSDGSAPSGGTATTTTAATSTEAEETTTTEAAATTTGEAPATTTAKPTTATPKPTTEPTTTTTYTLWKPDPTKPTTSTAPTTTTTRPPVVNNKPDPRPGLRLEAIDVNEAFLKDSYIASNGQRLPYRYYIPDNYNGDKYAYPVVLFLHGAGERGGNNTNQLRYMVQTLFEDKNSLFYDSIVIAPQCPDGVQWVDTPWDKEDRYHVDNLSITDPLYAALELLDEMMYTYSINPDRQYVIGLSMGAFGAWDAVMRYPDRFAAAVPVSGGGDPSYATKLLDMPIWTFHSPNDSVVPFNNTKKMVDAILAAGGTKLKFTQTIYDHWVWNEAAREPGLEEWLFAQRRDS